ncbi:MAG TPA: phospholipase D-like domain-containing protein [Ktedonobacteraceae bacterium]|nr:phospholipase D-like domain-containing protein [Ktedonobacteraceae bacterium]
MKFSQNRTITWKIPKLTFSSLLKLIGLMLGGLVSLEVLILGLLSLTTTMRKRRQGDQKFRFPHIDLDEMQLGDNTLQIYSYGQDVYDAMLEAIDGAKKCIYLETYIWKDDKVGQIFKEHLARKAAEGVQVHVIFDSFGNLVVPHDFKIFPPEIHVLEYQSLRPWLKPWQVFNFEHYALDHRKVLITDGEIGFIGGYNLGSLYATEWRDTHLRLKGPVAADLGRSFIDFWNRNHASHQIDAPFGGTFDPFLRLQENDAHQLTFPIRDMYITAINQARSSILLSNAYFVPDHTLLNALQAAARRGVDVRILIPWNSNHVMVKWLTNGFLTSCMDAGIHIMGYKKSMLHAKTCMIDDKWVTIGTANLDRLSSLGNYEINIEIYSKEVAKQMRSLFECDETNAFELKPDEWKKRPWYSKFSELVLSPLRFIG